MHFEMYIVRNELIYEVIRFCPNLILSVPLPMHFERYIVGNKLLYEMIRFCAKSGHKRATPHAF